MGGVPFSRKMHTIGQCGLCARKKSDMGIVVITIPGRAKREFVNSLHRATDGRVDLVIIQKPRHRGFMQSLARLRRTVGWLNFPKELWYALVLRFDKRIEKALTYFRETSLSNAEASFLPPVIETDSVNSDDIHRELAARSPDLFVVWGSTILQPRILTTGKQAINLHFGYCPHYRGALANQHAVFSGDRARIGATIHHINGKADAGAILALIPADVSQRPRELFRKLNDEARERYVEIATRLLDGESLPVESQDNHNGNVLLLKQWTPSLRYDVGRKVLEWERSMV